MNKRLSGVRGTLTLLAAMAVGVWCVPEASAGGHGSRGGGRAPRPPHVSMPRGGFNVPRMPRAAAPARANLARARGQSNHTMAHSNSTMAGSNLSSGTGQSRALASTTAPGSPRAGLSGATSIGTSTATGRGLTGAVNSAANSGVGMLATSSGAALPTTYTYGSGTNAQGYRAYGYGRGYRNRYYGNRYGYGRSQGNNRAIIARLRAVQMALARVNHDYQGHRVRAMHAITMAIRQLSHRSMIYGSAGFAPGMNNGAGMGLRGGGGGLAAGAGGRRGQVMNQAQSDAIMSQSLRTLQGIGMQLGSLGSNTMGHARASGHIQMAVRELNTALSIR